MHRLTNTIRRHARWGLPIFVSILAAVLIVGLGGRTDAGAKGNAARDAKADEQAKQDASYAALVAASPAHLMTNTVSRDTINFWTDTWNKKGQVDFVYVREGGKTTGYYVLAGPPVSLCTSITPNYTTQRINADGSGGADEQVIVNAPGIDGVFYSGGDCNRLYGKDAATGRYLGFMIGYGISIIESTTPLSQYANAEKLGDADATKATVDPKTGLVQVGS